MARNARTVYSPCYNQAAVDDLNPEDMFASISGDSNGCVMPGWEPERMSKSKTFAMYQDIDEEALFANLKYFLERIMPVCNQYDIKMAIHRMILLGVFLDSHE